jgi:hypothetical protein
MDWDFGGRGGRERDGARGGWRGTRCVCLWAPPLPPLTSLLLPPTTPQDKTHAAWAAAGASSGDAASSECCIPAGAGSAGRFTAGEADAAIGS